MVRSPVLARVADCAASSPPSFAGCCSKLTAGLCLGVWEELDAVATMARLLYEELLSDLVNLLANFIVALEVPVVHGLFK